MIESPGIHLLLDLFVKSSCSRLDTPAACHLETCSCKIPHLAHNDLCMQLLLLCQARGKLFRKKAIVTHLPHPFMLNCRDCKSKVL